MQNFLKGKNKSNLDKRKVIYDERDILLVLKEVNYILCSLHDMGSYYWNKDKKLYERETTQFIDNSLICNRLAGIRTILNEQLNLEEDEDEMDELEYICQEIPYWRKPGDYCKDIWIKEIVEDIFGHEK